MSYLINYLQDDQTLAVTFNSDFDLGGELTQMMDELLLTLDQVDGRVTILNQFDASTFDLADVIAVTKMARNRNINVFEHPNVGRVVGVTKNKVVQLTTCL